MDQPFPRQFNLPRPSLVPIDYATLKAMLTARECAWPTAQSGVGVQRCLTGTINDRIAFFAGKRLGLPRFGGPFASVHRIAVKRKAAVYLGASVSGRMKQGKCLGIPDVAVAARAGEES